MDLFQLGEVTLSSGAKSYYKIDCDQLSDGSIRCLARLAADLMGGFGRVVGVPRGGLRLAEALQAYLDVSSSRWLLVDDVLTTGRSMNDHREDLLEQASRMGEAPTIIGAVLFARGPCPHWVRPLLPLPKELWLDPERRPG